MLTAFPSRNLPPAELLGALHAQYPAASLTSPFANGKKRCRDAKKAHWRLQAKPNVQLKIETKSSGELRQPEGVL